MDFSTCGYVCDHSHFYQVLSENPWFEAVELQESAYPCHDWNERVTADCYAPSAAVGLLDGENQNTNIVNNYAGSALTSVPGCSHGWVSAPRVNRASLDAAKESRERFSGYGSAIIQAYNHVILHLTRSRDKRTLVIWRRREWSIEAVISSMRNYTGERSDTRVGTRR